jgi:hypothetical protein
MKANFHTPCPQWLKRVMSGHLVRYFVLSPTCHGHTWLSVFSILFVVAATKGCGRHPGHGPATTIRLQGGERGLVSLPVFKTGAPGDPRWAGSIPVRLRAEGSGGPPGPWPSHPPAAARLRGRVRFPSASATMRLRRTARPVAISPARRCAAPGRVRFPSASALKAPADRQARGHLSRPPLRGFDPRFGSTNEKGRGARSLLHFQSIAHRGACGKGPIAPHNRGP